jgi:DNA-binding HxlR family transcriptional regulator
MNKIVSEEEWVEARKTHLKKEKEIVSEYPIRVEYSLTDIGKAFQPVLLSAASFSMKYMPKASLKMGNLEHSRWS